MRNQTRSKYLARFTARQIATPRTLTSKIFVNLVAFFIVTGFLTLMVWGAGELHEPIKILQTEPISLSPHKLVQYSLQTLVRMMVAVVFSLIFSILYAICAAKIKHADYVLVPLLDVLQSVPILGYISFTVAGFVAMFPGSTLGPELAAIFAIFTSQVWNMTFSFYQSLKTIPKELEDVSEIFNLTGWQKFWRLELPYGIPGLAWNMAISISSSWFFIVAAEAITVGNYTLNLQGVGSYISLAIQHKDLYAMGYAVIAMIIVILLYDQLVMRPIVAWSDKFKYELSASEKAPESWVLNIFRRSILIQKLFRPLQYFSKVIVYFPADAHKNSSGQTSRVYAEGANSQSALYDYAVYSLLLLMLIASAYHLFELLHNQLGWTEVIKVFEFALITLARILIFGALVSLIWIPIGVYIGLNPRVTELVQPIVQFLAAFPANLLFPVAVIGISKYQLNPDIWLSPLIIIGTQWYILFNVIAGAASIPHEFKETTQMFGIKGWLWWRKVVLPSIAPYFMTGAITAYGGAWNASIVAELVSFGDAKLVAKGLGSYIAEVTVTGDFHRIVLGIVAMCILVVTMNKLFWQPLQEYVNKKFQL